MFQVVDKSVFGTVMPIEVGMSSYAQTEGGGMTMFTITKIEGDQVTVDFNHVMAGKTLEFSVEVVDVREATKDEVAMVMFTDREAFNMRFRRQTPAARLRLQLNRLLPQRLHYLRQLPLIPQQWEWE